MGWSRWDVHTPPDGETEKSTDPTRDRMAWVGARHRGTQLVRVDTGCPEDTMCDGQRRNPWDCGWVDTPLSPHVLSQGRGPALSLASSGQSEQLQIHWALGLCLTTAMGQQQPCLPHRCTLQEPCLPRPSESRGTWRWGWGVMGGWWVGGGRVSGWREEFDWNWALLQLVPMLWKLSLSWGSAWWRVLPEPQPVSPAHLCLTESCANPGDPSSPTRDGIRASWQWERGS